MGLDPFTAAALGGLGSAAIGGLASNSAADAQADASDRAIAEQRRQFDTILGLTQPQRDVGNAALNVLAGAFIPGFSPSSSSAQPTSNTNALFGLGGFSGLGAAANFAYADSAIPIGGIGTAPIPTGGAVSSGDASGLSLADQFAELPGAQFIVDESMRNIGNSYAARGGALSGNSLRALQDRGQELTNSLMFDRLFQLAGFGNPATSTAANAASATGANVSNALINQGNARASGIAGTAQSLNNGLQGGLSNYLLWQQLQPSGTVGMPGVV